MWRRQHIIYICGGRIDNFWGHSLHRMVFLLSHIARTIGVENIGHPHLELTRFPHHLNIPLDGVRGRGK